MKRPAQSLMVSPQFTGVVAGILLVAALTGCQSVRLGSYVTPEVRGRVLAADTRQPLDGVKVMRVTPKRTQNGVFPEKGVQSLEQHWTAATDGDGRFLYPSQSYFLVFHRANWWVLNLSFQSPGRITLQTNLTPANLTGNLPDGTSQVDLGEILLEPDEH